MMVIFHGLMHRSEDWNFVKRVFIYTKNKWMVKLIQTFLKVRAQPKYTYHALIQKGQIH